MTLSTVPEQSGEPVASGRKNRNGTEIMKPQSVLDYNKAKMRVDKSDKMTFYNTALRRSTKWYRKLEIELLTGTAVVNSWALYNQFHCQRIYVSITDFKEGLATSLITGVIGEELLPVPRCSDVGGKRTNHALVEAAGPELRTRKWCMSCYKVIANNEGSSVTIKRVQKSKYFLWSTLLSEE